MPSNDLMLVCYLTYNIKKIVVLLFEWDKFWAIKHTCRSFLCFKPQPWFYSYPIGVVRVVNIVC